MSMSMHTQRLLIRMLNEADVEAIADIWGNSKVMAHCGGPIVGVNRLARSIQYYQTIEAEKGISAYGVCLQDTEALIGVCGFNPTETSDVYELIYHFKESEWGKGYATEAAAALLDYLRNHISREVVRQIRASIAPENIGSERVLLRCGFHFSHDEWFDDTQRFEPVYVLEL